MAGTDPIGSSNKPYPQYPDDDPAKKLADQVAKKVAGDGLKTDSKTYADVLENQSAAASAWKAAKFGGAAAWQFAQAALPASPGKYVKAMEVAREAYEKIEHGDIKGAVKLYAEYGVSVTIEELEHAKVKGTHGPLLLAKALEGTHALIKTFNYAKSLGADDNDLAAQVRHNEQASVTVNKYLLDRGLISQRQYDAALDTMSPEARQFAKGTSSLDDRSKAFAAAAKATGAEKQIEGDLRRGEAIAVTKGIHSKAELATTMLVDPAFRHAYATNLAFRAGVDGMIEKYQHDRPAYDERAKCVVMPGGPIKC